MVSVGVVWVVVLVSVVVVGVLFSVGVVLEGVWVVACKSGIFSILEEGVFLFGLLGSFVGRVGGNKTLAHVGSLSTPKRLNGLFEIMQDGHGSALPHSWHGDLGVNDDIDVDDDVSEVEDDVNVGDDVDEATGC